MVGLSLPLELISVQLLMHALELPVVLAGYTPIAKLKLQQ